MPSDLQDVNVADIDWDSLTEAQLEDLRDNDDRTTVQSKAASLLQGKEAPASVSESEYDNPRLDPGPPRREDEVEEDSDFEPAELSAEEVDPEESRKDETTLLASDTVRVNEDNELEIVPSE